MRSCTEILREPIVGRGAILPVSEGATGTKSSRISVPIE